VSHGVAPVGEVKHYPGRITFFVVLVCILAASGGLMFGYDVGISGKPWYELLQILYSNC